MKYYLPLIFSYMIANAMAQQTMAAIQNRS